MVVPKLGIPTTNSSHINLSIKILSLIIIYQFISYDGIVQGQTANDSLYKDPSETIESSWGQMKFEGSAHSKSVVKPNEIEKTIYISPDKLLPGKLAGVNTIQGDGAPGSTSEIYIRGVSDFYFYKQPLYVLDGVPLTTDETDGVRNPLNELNPADIDNIAVIKDGSALLQYGLRAASGAILITTKKAKEDGPLHIQYSNSFSLGRVAKKYSVYDAESFRALVNRNFAGNDTITGLLGSASTDWQDEIYRNAFGHNHYLALGGGIKGLPYRISTGYTNQEGVLKTDQLKRLTYQAYLSPVFLQDHLKITLQFRGSQTNNQFADKNAIASALLFDPTQAVYDPNSPFGGYTTHTYFLSGYGDIPYHGIDTNPLALINMQDDHSRVDQLWFRYGFNYKIHGLEQVSIHYFGANQRKKSNRDIYVPGDAPWKYFTDYWNGFSGESASKLKNHFHSTFVRYDQKIGSNGSNISILTGYNWQSDNRDYQYHGSSSNPQDSEQEQYSATIKRSLFYSTGTLTIKNKYKLSADYSRNGSSRYGEENKFSDALMGTLAWRVDNEKFMQSVRWLNLLDIHFSLASNRIGIKKKIQGQLGSPSTALLDAGLDAAFRKDRIHVSFNMYSRHTEGFLSMVPVASGINLSQQVLLNAGNIVNKGIELAVNAYLVKKKEFLLNAWCNFSYNKNEVTFLTHGEILPITNHDENLYFIDPLVVLSPGNPAGTFYLYEQIYDSDGNPIEGLYNDNASPPIYLLGNRKITGNSIYPSSVMGFGASLAWKQWEAGFNGRFLNGNYVYNKTEAYHSAISDMLQHNGAFLRNLVVPENNDHFIYNQRYSDYYAQSAAFLRLDELKIAYNFNHMIGDKLKLKVYLASQNLFVLTNYAGPDPEVASGVDNAMYPRPQTFLAGIVANFQ